MPANLTIGKNSITVTADPQSKVYGATDPTLTYKITSGILVGTDTLTGSLSRAVGESAGAYAISSTLANANYDVLFVPANLTIGKNSITVTADAKTKTYGEVDPALTYKITTGALVGSDALTGSLSRQAGERAGNYGINQGMLTNPNYEIAFVGADLTIGKKAITVTADAKTKTYGEKDPALSYTITAGALVGSDSLEGRLSRAVGESVGTYAISSTLTNASYDVLFVPANLTIGKNSITVTADPQSKE